MKYNYTSYDDDGQKLYKGIIELEPIDESEETHFDEIYEEARQSAPESKMVKHIEETLESKLNRAGIQMVQFKDRYVSVPHAKRIAKEHYQEHPNEIVNLSYKQKWHKTGYNMGREDALSGMVSHSKVMEVFKNTHTPVECNWDCNECYNSVRTALQNMS